MPNTRTLQRSFAGGEMSPEMFGRIDDVKFQTGAAKLRNFIATPQGPAENRPGFAFVREVKYSNKKTRLIPFTFSTTQTMVIELGDGYIRFHTQGGTLLQSGAPYEITSPYAEADLFDIHYVQSADIITLVHQNYAPRELRRLSATNWTLTTVSLTSPISAPGTPTVTSSGFTSAKYTYRYVVTAVAADSISESEASASASVSSNLFETGCTNTISWSVVTGASRYKVYKLQGGIYGYIGQSSGTSIIDDNIAPDMSLTPPIYDNVFSVAGQITNVPITNGGSFYGTTINPITSVTVNSGATYTSIPTITSISDSTGSGANLTVNYSTTSTFFGPRYTITGFTVVSGGALYTNPTINISSTGYLSGTNSFTINRNTTPVSLTVTDTGGGSGASLVPVITGGAITGVNIVSPGSGYFAPVVSVSFAGGGSGATFGTPTVASSGDYPAAVSYFEQRRCFAGTKNRPQSIFMTKSGTETDMSYSLPIRDDDRIKFRVAAREANTIRHIVPLTQLILLTAAAEWRVSSVNSDALTPSSISVRPQSYVGASNVQPWIINNSLVYCAARGGHVRELGYSWQSNGFITGDLSLRSAHLFDDYEILDMCYSKAPRPLLWFVSSSGKLLGLTYIPEQQIGAWHQHDTDGVFESCTTVAEGSEDVLYVVVKRTINGATKRYVERMQTRHISGLENCFFVDCGLTYNGTNTTSKTVTISGGTNYDPSETLTIFMSGSTFSYPGTTNVNDAIVLKDASGNQYRVTITSVLANNEALGRVDNTLPVSLRNTATTNWSLAIQDISGLSHLEGKTVSILADGAVQPRQVVTSGTVSIPRAATIIHVGLPYNSDLQTLPVAMQIDGFGQGRFKNVNKAWLRVYQSSGIFIGPDETNLTEAKQRTTEPYGSPPALKSQEILVMLTPSWQDSGQVYVRQSDPLPLSIVSMTLEVSVGS